MDKRVGQRFGNYRLTRLLGEGGFAQVYLGEHLHLTTLVAVKVLHTKFVTREQEEFLREARTIASLEHPSIVRVLDCGIEAEQDEPFIIMHYAANGTLRQRYPKGTRLSPATTMEYIQQVASALQYAHDFKVIHRDVKPENMLLGAKDELLLSDFGIALISSSSSSQSTKAAAGTVAYMAPEQILGKPRPASDQYALGIVVYEWLSGTTPFHGSFAEMCAQHLYAPPPSLCEILPWLDSGIEQVILKALAKEPQDRFASVIEFATALEQSVQRQYASLPVTEAASPPDDSERASDPFRTNSITMERTANKAPDDPVISPKTQNNTNISTSLISTITTDTPILAKTQTANTPFPVNVEDQFTLPTATENASPLTNPSIPIADDEPTFVKAGALSAPDLPGQAPANTSLVKPTRRFDKRLQIVVIIIIIALLILSPVAYFTLSHARSSYKQSNTSAARISFSPTPTNIPVGGAIPRPTATAVPTATPTSLPTATPTPQPVQRQLSAVQAASNTVNATGQGETQGTHATGILTFVNASSGSKVFTFTAGSTFLNDEKTHITMMIDETVTLPLGATKNVRAHIVEIGTIGNLAPFKNTGSGFYCCQEDPFDMYNQAPFTGGTDPHSYTYVQQSDINNTAAPLISSTEGQARANVQNQLRPDEHLLSPVQCRSNTTANHAAGEKATTVTVTVTTTCTATAST